MKKILSTTVLALSLGFGGASAVAATANNQVIKSVGCYDEAPANVACFLIVDGPAIGPAACSNSQVRWDGTSTTGKNLTAVAMTSYAIGNKIRISYDDAECFAGGTTFPKVKWMFME